MKLNLSMGLLAALQLVASLAVQFAVLRIVGAGARTDAFVAAQTVPLVLLAVLSGSLQSVWQPRLAVLAGDRARWRAEQAAAQGQVLLSYGAVATVLALLAFAWSPLLFPGFDAQQHALTAALVVPLFAASALNCHAMLFTTALRAIDRFVLAELVALSGTLVLLLLVVLLVPRFGVQAAAWAALARAVVVVMALYALAQRPAVSVRRALGAGAVWEQLRPLVAGSSLYKTAPLIDRYWSSIAAPGGVTALGIIQMGMGALGTVLERAIAVPVAPHLARMVERRELHAVRAAYRRCVLRIGLASGFIALALVALYPVWPDLTKSLLALPAHWARPSWWIALLLLGYLLVSAAGTIVVAAFLALGDARTPVRVGVIGFLIGAALKAVGFLGAGLPGLAAATSIYYLGNMAALCWFLERTLDEQTA